MSPGYFTDDSVLRQVHRERAVALSGPRALLMQAAHPLAVSGLLAHSTALDEPYERLARTARVLSTIGFGSKSDADRAAAKVRAMHRRVQGRLKHAAGPYPAGTRYRADDPDLLLWVLFTLVDSALVVYRKYVGPLSAEDAARLWDDYRVIGRLFGLRERDMPRDTHALDEYRRTMLDGDRLYVSDWARERAREIVLRPPVPWAARPLLETANFITIALLPDSIREQYGFSALPPLFVRKALVEGGAQYVRRAVSPSCPTGCGSCRRWRLDPYRRRLRSSRLRSGRAATRRSIAFHVRRSGRDLGLLRRCDPVSPIGGRSVQRDADPTHRAAFATASIRTLGVAAFASRAPGDRDNAITYVAWAIQRLVAARTLGNVRPARGAVIAEATAWTGVIGHRTTS